MKELQFEPVISRPVIETEQDEERSLMDEYTDFVVKSFYLMGAVAIMMTLALMYVA